MTRRQQSARVPEGAGQINIIGRRRSNYGLAGLGLLAALAVCPASALAAGSGVTIDNVDASRFPTVRLSVSVFTAAGAPALGLDSRSFAVAEDGKAVTDAGVEPLVDPNLPLAAAILVDTSGSMTGGTLDLAKQIAGSFVETLRPADTAAVVAFNPSAQVVQAPTKDHSLLAGAIGQLRPDGATPVYDVLLDTATKLDASAPHRRLIVLVSDGHDTASRTPVEAMLGSLQRIGVPVASVGIGDNVRHDVLDRIGAVTGGGMIYPGGVDNSLRAFLTSVEDRQRWQYAVSYQSHVAADNQPHKLSVSSVNAPGASAVEAQFTPPGAAASTAPSPTSVASAPVETAPNPSPARSGPELDSSYLIALLAVVVVAGAGIALMAWHARTPRPTAESAAAEIDRDATEDILPAALAPAQPRAVPTTAAEDPITVVPLAAPPGPQPSLTVAGRQQAI